MIRRIKHTSKWYNRTVAVVFVLLLFFPTFQKITSVVHEPQNLEKRKPVPFPVLKSRSIDDVHLFIRHFELWFNDHFGLRKLFIRINSIIDYRVFHTSPKAMVVVGKNGWLYYNNYKDGKNLNDYWGYVNFTKDELNKISKNLEGFKGMMAKRGIPVLFVLAANKHTIYPEFLPDNMRHVPAPVTRADQVDSLFAISGIPFIDLRPVMRNARKHFPCDLYSKTDSHWNELGAFVGYQYIIRNVRSSISLKQYYTINDFTLSMHPDKGTGDLADLIFMSGQLSDQDIKLKPKRIPMHFYVNGSYNQHTVIYGNMDKSKPRLLMFHDSFTLLLRNFLAEDFSHSAFVWSEKVYFQIIDSEKPDMLIVEFAERKSEMLLNLY